MKLNWNDLRIFLAVVEQGSTIRAASSLGMDQTTCARRVGELERALGLTLFDRKGGRYVPNADALVLAEPVRSMGAASAKLGELAAMRKRDNRLSLKVTADEALASAFVIPAVTRLATEFGDLNVEIDVTAEKRDLLAGEADVAVRGGLEPDEPGLVRRKLTDDPVGFYVGSSYPDPPFDAATMRKHPIACFDVLVPRFAEAGMAGNVRHVVNSATALRAIVAAGHAVGLMPRSIAETAPALTLCLPVPVPVAIWLVYPERLRRRPEIARLSNLLDDSLGEARARHAIG